MLNKTDPAADKKQPVVIKKYANRRLYNTETSVYVTLEDLATMVRSERDFVVYDAKSGEELTHAVLTQIIVEQESRAGTQTLLPIPFLRQLIRFYGDTMERMVPSYLQMSLDTLSKEQDRYRKQFTNAFTPHGAFEAYQEHARKNLALFEQAMAMFTPFGQTPFNPLKPAPPTQPSPTQATTTQSATLAPVAKRAGEPQLPRATEAAALPLAGGRADPGRTSVRIEAPPSTAANDIAELKAQLAAMQAKIEKLAHNNKG